MWCKHSAYFFQPLVWLTDKFRIVHLCVAKHVTSPWSNVSNTNLVIKLWSLLSVTVPYSSSASNGKLKALKFDLLPLPKTINCSPFTGLQTISCVCVCIFLANRSRKFLLRITSRLWTNQFVVSIISNNIQVLEWVGKSCWLSDGRKSFWKVSQLTGRCFVDTNQRWLAYSRKWCNHRAVCHSHIKFTFTNDWLHSPSFTLAAQPTTHWHVCIQFSQSFSSSTLDG